MYVRTINDIDVQGLGSIKHIGVIFDSKMSFNEHVHRNVNKSVPTLDFTKGH